MDGFGLIADETRRGILDRLRAGESDVSGLVSALERPQPHVSKHLRTLREHGAVRVRVRGNRRVYSLAPEPLADVVGWVRPYYALWNASLDRLGALLDEDEEGR